MTEETRQRLEATVRHVLELLVAREYQAIETLTEGVRLKRCEIEAGVLEYGRRLTPPPNDAYGLVDAVPISNAWPQEYSIRFRLYTEEEGRSDLEIQATLIDIEKEPLMKVEFDNVLAA
ncbi:hypothetical protein BH11VER1_BH11VER1_13690 [soil metagenome]